MRDAESLLDQVISFSGNEISDESVTSILGVVDYDIYLRLSDIMHEHGAQEVLDLLAEVIEAGYDLSEFLSGLADFWRNLLILNSMRESGAELLDVPETYHKSFTKAADSYDERDLLRLLNLTLSVQNLFRNVQNQRIYLENFLLKLIHFTESVQLDALMEQVSSGSTNPGTAKKSPAGGSQKSGTISSPKKPKRNIGQKKTRIETATKVNDKETVTASTNENKEMQPTDTDEEAGETTPLELEKFQKSWKEFAEFVKEKKGILGEFINECEPVKVQGKVLEVLFDDMYAFHMKTVVAKSSVVEELVLDFYDAEVKLRCRSGDTGRSEISEEDDIIDDPITQAIIEQFDGEIIR